MSIVVVDVQEEEEHKWAVVHCSCDIDQADDKLICDTVTLVRDSYGENEILSIAELPFPDPSVSQTFQLNLDFITKGFRKGLPNPDQEGKKPAHLTNYRSESTEFIARMALQAAYEIEFPVSLQRGKANANQPILGFDGWGIENDETDPALVLVQVKGTEEDNSPPKEATTLVTECKKVPIEPDKISRALSVVVIHLKDSPLLPFILKMLELLGNDQLPKILVAPSIIRGTRPACIGDLQPLRDSCQEFSPAAVRGVSVSIGTGLTDFGYKVMSTARAAA